MQCKSFLEQKERAAKGDKNSSLEWQIYWFVVVVTTPQDLKYGPNMAANEPIEEEQGPTRC